MMKLGRVSKVTRGAVIEFKVEDKILCRPGEYFWLQGSGCPGG